MALCLGLGMFSTSSFAIEGFPGSIWSRSTKDFNDVEGLGNQGNLTQGVQWVTLPWDIPVVTYGAYRWRVRELNKTYYDAYGPAAGIEFTKEFIRWGAEYEWQRYPKLNERSKNFSIYATWFKSFDFISGENPSLLGSPVIGFPTATWGRVSSDFNNLEGVGTMGYVSQGIEWFKLPGDVVFRTLALYNWRFRTNNKQFYNVHGPSAAIEFGWKSMSLGTEYAWQKYPELNTRTNDFRAYLTFYFDWDLAPKARLSE